MQPREPRADAMQQRRRARLHVTLGELLAVNEVADEPVTIAIEQPRTYALHCSRLVATATLCGREPQFGEWAEDLDDNRGGGRQIHAVHPVAETRGELRDACTLARNGRAVQ